LRRWNLGLNGADLKIVGLDRVHSFSGRLLAGFYQIRSETHRDAADERFILVRLRTKFGRNISQEIEMKTSNLGHRSPSATLARRVANKQ